MSTFLQLCQDTVQESGTIQGDNQPSTVSNQSGRLADFVRWVADAWTDVQNQHPGWLWMRGEFEEDITSAASQYDAVADFGLARWADWITHDKDGCPAVSMFKTSVGASDEMPLMWRSWDEFRRTCLFGVNRTRSGRPSIYTVDTSRRLVFWPEPDATYTVRGPYRKGPQALLANSDTPEMPSRFHKLIVYAALLKAGTYDEAMNQFPLWTVEYRKRMSELELDQLPALEMSGPLA